MDELVGKVRRWGRRVWVWVAQDVKTKAWLAWWVGRRKQVDAHRLIHRVKAVQAEDHVPAYSSDGLNQYFYGLTAHYGQWVEEEGRRKPVWQVLPELLYGQLRKRKRGYRLKHVYTKMLCGARAVAYTERSLRRRIAMAAAYYNYCRTHQSLRVEMGAGRYRGRTPTMALGGDGTLLECVGIPDSSGVLSGGPQPAGSVWIPGR
ncbi:MAG: hypothetical protein GYB65_11950 [Chloroflexi bacterium]|nr:hypothetical protein [Chloroflexota bacterium]